MVKAAIQAIGRALAFVAAPWTRPGSVVIVVNTTPVQAPTAEDGLRVQQAIEHARKTYEPN